ncbi:hypothetical protein Tco_0902927, partial [Tanacetum coccineum]
NMANENVPAHAPTKSDDQILLFAAWVPIGKSNFLDEDWFILDANLLREALEITPVDQAHQFVSPPSGDAIMDFVNQLGYLGEIHFVSRMAVNNLYQPWRAILLMINQCLTGKTFGFDRPRYLVLQMLWGIITRTNVDYAELMWEEFVQAIQTFLADKANLGIPTKKGKKTKPHVIPYCRFTKLIIYYLGRIHNIHQRSGSPLNLAEDDLSLGNIKFVPKGETDEQPKPVPSKKSKPAPATKPKVTLEKPSEPSLAKHPKRVEDNDLNRAIQMSLETFQAHGQAPVGGVAIRERVEEATRQLLVVEGKGKEIATDEQASQSLLALHTPKRRSVTGQFIFHRRTLTGPSVQPQDDASANIVCDSPSPVDAETEADTDITSSTANTEVLYAEDVHGEEISHTVVLEEKTAELDEGQAGSDPEEEPRKTTMETNAESMVTVPIHQASISVLPLSTPIIDLSPPKLVSSPLQEPVIVATTKATTTTLPLLPPPQKQSKTNSSLASRLRDLPHKINQTVNEVVKEVVHVALQDPLRDRFRELPEADMKEILHKRMFESGSYKSLPEHLALYEALEASMKRENRDEFLAEKDKSRKRRRDNQDPPPPPPDSNLSKKKRHDSDASGSK